MVKTARKKTTWQKTRKFFNDIHLWAGLISGIVVILICFSGTIYTYNTELREWASPHLHKVEIPANGKRLPADDIIKKIEETSGGTVTSISIPADPARTYQFSARIEGDRSRFGTTYYVNPYTGDITGTSKEKTKTGEFMQNMFSLHRWLLLDKIEEPLIGELPNRQLGSYISGTATILFTLGVLTGLVIWFPQKLRTWKQGLKIKWSGNWKRINHDLHNSLAFYSLIFLFLMGITGPQWSFPWYRTGLQKTLGTYKEQPAERDGGPGRANAERGGRGKPGNEGEPDEKEQKAELQLLPFASYLAAADQALPYTGDYRLSLPKDAETPLSISKNRVGFFAPAAGDQVSLDASTAAVKDVRIFRDKPFNERVAASIKALHVGNIYGQFTKLIYFLACLVATTLPITGTLIWLNKMKKKPAKQHRKIPTIKAAY
ncbi:PepSY-associated TM helix domain-containing protein [Parapedobacter tibetensis]|uniref:PepSY-associated TM helix domain-containing protein n=1 Tax=Parapedobacter tibetensis TaxID=2972951 RepID=UPI00214DB076|nr:PepSY-associated TM helix domain-containing protein [Parapedobacter tibetensis]